MAKQKAYSLDKITRNKILKGAFWATSVPAILGLLTYIGQLEINNEFLALFAGWAVPVAINAVKEWRKGQ